MSKLLKIVKKKEERKNRLVPETRFCTNNGCGFFPQIKSSCLYKDMFLINSPLKNLGDEACKVFHSEPHPLHVGLYAGEVMIDNYLYSIGRFCVSVRDSCIYVSSNFHLC